MEECILYAEGVLFSGDWSGVAQGAGCAGHTVR